MTRQVALIGYPVRHSISAIFQQAAFDACQLDLHYELWEVPNGELETAIASLRYGDWLGANVTIPYKERVIPMLDEVDPRAREIGAVNTIVCNQGTLTGFNTDAVGFLRALRQDGGFEPQGKRAVILGAGGAARAIAFALVEAGVASLFIINRTMERAATLAQDMALHGKGVILAGPWEASIMTEVFTLCHLIVNCTPLGMRHTDGEQSSPIPESLMPRQALIFDVVYNPPETPLLRQAKKTGASALGGLPMLIHQGAEAFKLWTGQEAPLEVMRGAAGEALR
ncbi:MAG: shikimate dehydrogenase [Chloroflexi bacterium]|nr:shikimate dehydrogenase [Chloroflexota bacterium]